MLIHDAPCAAAGQAQPQGRGDVGELLGRRCGGETLADRQRGRIVAESDGGCGERSAAEAPESRGYLDRRAEKDGYLLAVDVGELGGRAVDVLRTAHGDGAAFLTSELGTCALVGLLGKLRDIRFDRDGAPCARHTRNHACDLSVLGYGVKRHATSVDAPGVHVDRVELAGDAGLEDALPHGARDAAAIVDDAQAALRAFTRRGDENGFGSRIAGVAQHLDDHVLGAANIVLGLTSLGLGAAKTNEAISEVVLDSEMAFAGDLFDELFEIVLRHGGLLGNAYRAALANDDDLHLAGVLHLVFDLLRYIVGQDLGGGLVDDLGLHHDANLAAGLDGVGTLDALVRAGYLLELLEALDVGIEGFLARPGAGGRNGIRGLDDDVEHAVGLHVVVMRLDGVDDGGLLAEAAGEVGADDGMTAVDFAVDGLPDVVQQAGAFGGDGIESQLGGDDAGEIGDFERMVQHILAVARAIEQAAERVDELGMEIVHAGVEDGLLPRLVDLLVDELLGLLIHLLDTRGMDAPIGDEVLHGDTADFAADRVVAADGDAFGRVVDNEVGAGELFEGADVAPLAADDAALELVGGNGDGRDGDL